MQNRKIPSRLEIERDTSQKEIFDEYLEGDRSLSEIAESRNTTLKAVRDAIIATRDKHLSNYDENFHERKMRHLEHLFERRQQALIAFEESRGTIAKVKKIYEHPIVTDAEGVVTTSDELLETGLEIREEPSAGNPRFLEIAKMYNQEIAKIEGFYAAISLNINKVNRDLDAYARQKGFESAEHMTKTFGKLFVPNAAK